MSESKTKKASKTNAKSGKVAVPRQQLTFLPERSAYPVELEGATEDVVRVGDQTWMRRNRIVNQPEAALNRYAPPEWAAYLQSMTALGQKTAVHVRTVPEGFWLEDGRHRVLAAAELGWAYVKADIDRAGNAASSAVWRLHANSQRKADRPLDLALTWQEMLRPQDANPPGAGLTQKQVAELAGVSAATVSRRLRLVHPNLPFELAALAGVTLDERLLEPLFDVLDDKELVEAGAKAILTALKAKNWTRTPHDVLEVVAQAWTDANLAVPADHDLFGYEVRQDAAFRKAAKTFGAFTVKVPDAFNPGRQYEQQFYRNAEAALKTAQEISDRLHAEAEEAERKAAEREAKRRAKAGKDGKTLEVGEAPKRRPIEDRLPERTRKVQLEAMVRWQRAQVSYPDTILVEALARFIDKCGVLHSKADQAAALAALGVAPESEQADAMTGYGVSIEGFYSGLAPKTETRYGLEGRSEDGFHALWKKDKAAALRCVATALFFDHNQSATSVLGDDGNLAELLTGMNRESAEAVARQWLKDQDAGFKSVADGALCDHCDEPARLRRKGFNVCRSEFFDGITTNSATTRRLARMEAAKARAARATVPVEESDRASPAAEAEPAAVVEASPAEDARAAEEPPVEAPAADSAPEPVPEAVEVTEVPAAVEPTKGKRKGRDRAAAGA